MRDARAGFSFIDVIVGVGITTVLIGGIFLVYFSLIDTITNLELRRLGAAVLSEQAETVRNLPYASVGTLNGVPSGVLTQYKTVQREGRTFVLQTTVRNIDDPFDGTVGGTPNDTAPADYKLVEFELACTTCARFIPVRLTTTVAPKNLESTSQNGSLFVNVFDANGVGVAGASVRVVNASTSPTIDLTDITNAEGILQLVDVPTSTQSYRITVTKGGYSSEQTYASSDMGGSTPLKQHATVATQSLTQTSFAIDRTSCVTINTSTNTCSPVANQSFTMDGAKIIGTLPDVPKFSTTSVTDGSGAKAFSALEWDTYAIDYTGSQHLAGTSHFSPLAVNPGSTVAFRFILAPAAPSALLVNVTDATGASIPGASVSLTKSGFAETRVTGRALVTHTDWSGGAFAAQDDMETDSSPGEMRMQNLGGFYSTSTTATLVSTTVDVGGTPSQFYALDWSATKPVGTTLQFQVASNNDNATWNYVGPDGSSGSYFTSPNTAIGASHANHRYIRYKAYLSTSDGFQTPVVRDVTMEFAGPCVPSSQIFWNGLDSGTYDIEVTAAGYQEGNSTVPVSGSWQEATIVLSP